MNLLPRTSGLLLAGFFPFNTSIHDYNRIRKDSDKSLEESDVSETGLDRLKRMFQINEYGGMSTEVNSVYQAGFLGFLFGAIYGGVIHSRNAYLDFMENNQATAFKSHLDAKRKLQDQFTLSFAKGAFKWGWRTALFTTSYMGIITCVSTFRGESSIYEYLLAGSVTGCLYKINLGMRGAVAGSIVGGTLGGIGGLLSLLLLKATGTTMEEIRYWQYKWKLKRQQQVVDCTRDSK